MKKTLVALAALASVSAFAQTTVTLSGNMDVAGATSSGTQLGAKGTTFTTTLGTASTSVINLIAVEDLGGGTKVTAKYGLDPRTLTNDTYTVTNIPAAGSYATGGSTAYSNPQKNTITGLARDEAYIGIEGGFGSIKLGAPNSVSLDVNGASSPLGTGIGSGWGLTDGYGIRTVMAARFDRAARIDSPVINGFKASALFAPGNDETYIAYNSTSDAYVARNMPNNRKTTEVGLNYSNGPLNVQFANIQVGAQTYNTGFYGIAASTSGVMAVTAAVATKASSLGANYNFGSTTVYAAWWNGDSLASTTANVHVAGNRYAVKQNLGQVDVTLQYTQAVSGSATTTTAKIIGARADYNLSKTAIVYGGYESYDTGIALTTNGTTSGVRKVTSVGIRKSF